jgi:thiol-disulfide isomerase/thioredoxin
MRSVWVVILVSISVARAAGPPLEIRDIDGHAQRPFQPKGLVQVLFYIMTDCPISNFYAPEIQRICAEYANKGAGCSLVYEDVSAEIPAVRKHLEEYRYRGIPALVDTDRKAARRAGATVTPEVAVVDRDGKIRYHGRIDDFYAGLGKPRRQATTHELRDALDAVLAGKPVAVPEAKAVGCYIVSPDIFK